MAAKTYDYIITIKPSKSYEAFDWMSQLLLFIGVVLMVFFLVKIPKDNFSKLAGIVDILIVVGSWIFSRYTNGRYWYALLFSAVGFFSIWKNPWLGGAFLLLALLEKQVKFKQEIGVDEEGVAFNSFPKKAYQWHEVSNVVLKDGIITVDLHNNKIFQKELESDTAPAMEKEFNQFCRSHMLPVVASA